MKEADIVKQLDKVLELHGWLSFPQNSHVTHGRTRYKAGTPDIIACSPSGKFWGFVVKLTSRAKLQDSQKAMAAKFGAKKLAARYSIVYLDGGLKLSNTRYDGPLDADILKGLDS